MDLELEGETAIVTGASRGVGKEVARELLREETHPRVRDWLSTYVSRLSAQIEHEIVREEREF